MLFYTNLLLFESHILSFMSYFNLIKLNATPSTNTFLKKKYKTQNFSDGDLVWAINQTSGRGQHKNKWVSTPEDSLTFSILRLFENIDVFNPFLISLVVSLAITNSLGRLGILKLSIKWPNDILSCGKKVGGILIENFFKNGKLKASIIGVGLNLNNRSFTDFPNATSLKKVSGKTWNQKHLLNALMPVLHEALYETNFENLDTLLQTYNQQLWNINQKVTFKSNSGIYEAKLLGVSADGNLIIETDDKKVLKKTSNQIHIIYNSNKL